MNTLTLILLLQDAAQNSSGSAKELEAFQNSLKKGDKVIIGNSGIFGEIVEVDERTALVRVDGDTKLRVAKQVLTKDVTDVQK